MKVPRFATHPPLKVVIESTKKTLYFDEQKFQAFMDGEIEASELIEQTECDGLFRNQVELPNIHDDVVDSGSLWKLKDNKLVLVDDERYVWVLYPDNNFIEI